VVKPEEKVEGMHKDQKTKRLVEGPSRSRRYFSCLSKGKGEVIGS
jgi:hypothetical protein